MNTRGLQELRQPNSAYIHIPFCERRCGYCNFSLIANRRDLIPIFLDCLERELSETLKNPTTVSTIFLGGGTPTLLHVHELERLLSILRSWFPLSIDGEFTVEGNPLDLTKEKVALLISGGVNRLSFGGQSFSDRKLKSLERDHSGDDLKRAIELASKYCTNLSLDLIFAAPRETLLEWKNDLKMAAKMPLNHLSTYGLTIERGSHFYGRWKRGEVAEVNESSQLAMFELAIELLSQFSWQHYEVSNFCRSGHECQHNLRYWNGNSWFAFGPGAASFLPLPLPDDFSQTASEAFLTGPDDNGVLQSNLSPKIAHLGRSEFFWQLCTNHRSTTQYIKRVQSGISPVSDREILNLEGWIRQCVVFGLRQIAGIDFTRLDCFWGQPVRELFEPHLESYIQQGWVEQVGNRIKLTRAGLVISDSLWPNMLSSEKYHR